MRLDSFGGYPSGMEEYLSAYGWHFSKKMCEYAVSRMYKEEGEITPITKQEVDTILKRYNINLKNDAGYDSVYVANMCKADFLGSAVVDEARMALYIKKYIDDPDGYEGLPFNRFFADTIAKGIGIIWEDMI